MFNAHQDELTFDELNTFEYYLGLRRLKDEFLPEVFTKTMRTLEEGYSDIGLSQTYRLLRTEELYRG